MNLQVGDLVELYNRPHVPAEEKYITEESERPQSGLGIVLDVIGIHGYAKIWVFEPSLFFGCDVVIRRFDDMRKL